MQFPRHRYLDAVRTKTQVDFLANAVKTAKNAELRARLEKAERLITYSTMSMQEIAVACGFSSLPLFSRSFRARYGRPPSALRA